MNTPLASPIVRDGDTSFIGLQSRRNPLTIKEGYLQAASNVRLDRGIAQTRKGAKRLATGISAGTGPLTLPFALQTAPAGPTVRNVYTGGIFNSGIYSSPVYNNGNEYIVLVGPSSLFLWRQDPVTLIPSVTTLSYPTTPISETVQTGPTYIVTASVSGTTCTISCSGMNVPVGTTVNITSSIGQTNAVLGNKVVESSGNGTLTFSVASGTTAPTGVLSLSYNSPDLVNVVQAFDKLFLFRTRPTDLSKSATIAYTAGASTATVTCTGHGFSTGEVVRISGTSSSGLNVDAVITVTGANTFTYTVSTSSSANTASSGITAQRVQCPLYWDGVASSMARVPTAPNANGVTYSNMVAPYRSIATFHNNQMILAQTRDQVLVSDVLDPFNYDPLFKSFRTNTGSNDRLITLHPYADGQVIAFLRKSIFLGQIILAADGVSIDPANSSLQLLTNEVGCSARQTVATAGNYVYFLSDNGVYRLDNSQIDLALRGNSLPLSEPIADVMATINKNAVESSTGVYFGNRYYLAVPTILANGNPSPYCNTLLIYNQLNEAWESVDTYAFSLDNMVVSDYGSQRRLFIASNSGTLMLLDEYSTGLDDAASGAGGVPVTGSITTRRYFYGQLSRKRLGNVAVSAFLPAGSTVDVAAVTTDPDNTSHIATVTNSGTDNDYTIRAPIRRPGTYLDLTVAMSGGRPTIRAVSADATLPADTSRLARTES